MLILIIVFSGVLKKGLIKNINKLNDVADSSSSCKNNGGRCIKNIEECNGEIAQLDILTKSCQTKYGKEYLCCLEE